jgi:hypothetical protein
MTKSEALYFRNMLRYTVAAVRNEKLEEKISQVLTPSGVVVADVEWSSGVPFYHLDRDIREGLRVNGMLPWTA